MSCEAMLLSIRPKYVDKILDGTKRVELRKCKPRISPGDLVLMYATSPTKALVGAFRVDSVRVYPKEQLWTEVRQCAGVTREEFDAYYSGFPSGVGIFFSDVIMFDSPISLTDVRQQWPGFQPPQGYLYVTSGFVGSPMFS